MLVLVLSGAEYFVHTGHITRHTADRGRDYHSDLLSKCGQEQDDTEKKIVSSISGRSSRYIRVRQLRNAT